MLGNLKQEGGTLVGESNRTIRAITGVTVLMLFTKVLAMLRNIIQARVFGAGADMDLFTLANNYTVSLFTTVAYAFCVAAVPLFSRQLVKGKDKAFRLANQLLSLSLLVSVGLCAVLLLLNLTGAIPTLVGAGGELLFRQCFSVLLIALPIILLTYLLVALFQSMEHYNIQASLSLLYNVALCAVLLFAGDRLSLPVFALITAVSWLFQLAMVVPVARKERFRFKLTLRGDLTEIPHFFHTAMVTMVTTSVFLLCYLLNTRFAAGMVDGTASAYYYADKIFEPLATILIYSIGIVMFPKFNQKYEQLSQTEYCAYVSTVIKNSLLFLLPVSLLLAVFGEPIIRVLFEGGSFDTTATILTGGVFSAYAVGLAGFFLIDLLSKAYFAMDKNRTPLIASGIAIVLCLILNWIFFRFLPQHTSLLACGTSVALLCGGFGMYFHFCRAHKTILDWKPLVRGILLSLLMLAGVWFAYTQMISGAAGKFALVLQCGALGVAGFLFYVLAMGRSLPTVEVLRKLLGRTK